MIISTLPSDATQQHPRWCDESVCTALATDLDPMLRQHTGATFHYDGPTFTVDLTLIQPAMPGIHSDPYMIAAVGAPEGVDDSWGPRQAGATLDMVDAWALVDLASSLLEQVR